LPNAVFALPEPRFLHPLNLFNVLRQISVFGLVAIGMTFVILTAGIDLSVGALMALSGIAGPHDAKGGLDEQNAAVDAVTGRGLELTVIASVVIGLFGGIRGIGGTIVGACLIGVRTNGLVLLNVSSFIQQIVVGIILVAAVAFDRFAAEADQ
jgi:ribose/xylose/arabinose/galactoside ABC-type transport system permease subunit